MMMLLVCLCCLSPSFGHFSLPPQPAPYVIIPLPRPNTSAPGGVTLQRPELGGCTCVVLDRIGPCTSPSGSEIIKVLLCDPFSQNSFSCTWQWRDGSWIYTNCWRVHGPTCRLSISNAPLVPSALRFQSSAFTCSKHTVCITNEAFYTVVFRSESHSELVSGIHSVQGFC